MSKPSERTKRQRVMLQLRETRARLHRYEETVARQNAQLTGMHRRLAFMTGQAIYQRSQVPDAYGRGDQVLVTHHLRHRYAGRWQDRYCPVQRVRAGWVGRYVTSGVVQVDVYDPATGQVASRDVHLVEDPSGALRHVLLEDMTPAAATAQETTS